MQFFCNFFYLFFILSNYYSLAGVLKVSKFNFDRYSPAKEETILNQGKDYWWNSATEKLLEIIKENERNRGKVAKNVIIFIGDGMGISTITASRIYKGQRETDAVGEESELSFEKFPNVGLIKTYEVDKQIPDSAGTATAIFTGIKTRFEMIGLNIDNYGQTFDSEKYQNGKVNGIMSWAQSAGKDTGIVTTTKITDATPAATYANVNRRYWECDSKIPKDFRDEVKDIARQLIEDDPGRNFKVILGGGLQMLGHVNNKIIEECSREDGLNLTEIWMKMHDGKNDLFVTNNEELNLVDENTENLLGLFHPSNLPYELKRDKSETGTPSLLEMTKKALMVLKKSPNGFILMVEGGLIDKAHHKNKARLSLSEVAEFDRAIEYAINSVNLNETLILVTADHSHGFTMSGYPKRGNDILGLGNINDNDHSYYTLAYANGPGFFYHYYPNGSYPWVDVSHDENLYMDANYVFRAAAPLKDATHGGEDVAVYATGPGSQLIRGVLEQNYLAHVISHAACIGPQAVLNPDCEGNEVKFSYLTRNNGQGFILVNHYLILFCFTLNFLYRRKILI